MTHQPTQYAYVEVFDSEAPATINGFCGLREIRACWRYAGIAKRVSLNDAPTPILDDESRQAIRNAQHYLIAHGTVLKLSKKYDRCERPLSLATGLARVLDKIGGAK